MTIPRALKFVRFEAVEAHFKQGWVALIPNAPHHHQHYGIELAWLCDCAVPGGFGRKSVYHRVPINNRETLQNGPSTKPIS